MSFLCGAFAGVRGHLPGSGTGAVNGERSRRHTISNVVTSSTCQGSTGTPRAEDPNTDRAGRATVLDLNPKAPPTKHRRKSVTFSTVDVITHLPNTTVSSASSQTRSPEFSVQTRRNSTSSSPISVLKSGVNHRNVTDHAPGDRRSKRRYTVSGPPVHTRNSSPPQGTDPEDASSSRDRKEPSQYHTRNRRHTTLAPPSDYHPGEGVLDNGHGYDWQPPSEYVALRYQDSRSSTEGSKYDHSSTPWAGVTQEMVSPLQTPGGKRASFSVLPSIDGGTILFGRPNSSSAYDTFQYGDYSNSYGFREHPPYISSPQNSRRGPPIDSAQAYRMEGYQPSQYSIYRVDPPFVVNPPIPYFSASQFYSEYPAPYSSTHAEYTILRLASRFPPTHTHHSYSHPECLALLDNRTASFVPSHFLPPKRTVDGTGNLAISHAPNKKGLGLFTQMSLRTGEDILTEVPTLIVPSDAPNFLQNSGSALDGSTVDMYETVFELLSDSVRRDLMDLAWGGSYVDHRRDVNAYETIMRINPLAVSLPLSSAPGGSIISGSTVSSIHRGIFLKTSRINHSCSPNARWTFDPSSLTLILTSLRPINMGDEITINYISPYLTFSQRRAGLKNLFGFDCSCDSCFRILSQFHDNIQSRLIEESDSARTFLMTFWDSYPSFETWSENPSSYSNNLLISAHQVALEMIEREGLEELSSVQHYQSQWYTYDPNPVSVPDTTRHIDGIALCYGALSDVVNFRKWMARALDARLSRSGSGSTAAGGWGAFEDIIRNGGNGKFCQRNKDEVRLGHAESRSGHMEEVLRSWITNPEAFPAWGSRRSSPSPERLI